MRAIKRGHPKDSRRGLASYDRFEGEVRVYVYLDEKGHRRLDLVHARDGLFSRSPAIHQ